MLPEVKLDRNGFEEIAKEARSQIAAIYPEWTDYNYHDPGITFLELFAFLKEAQQFHMDQIGDRHKKKFLCLLGMTTKKRRPAELKAVITEGESCVLPMGSRFLAGDMIFETESEEYLPKGRIKALIVKERKGNRFITGTTILNDERQLMIHPFGRKPKPGNEFLICLSKPLEKGRKCHLSFRLYDDYPVKRNPIEREEWFRLLAEISLEFKAGDGYREAELTEDETRGLIQNGRMEILVTEEMEKSLEEGIEGYFLKIKFRQGEYDISPALTDISFHHVRLLQRETKACFDRAEAMETPEQGTDYYIKSDSGYRILTFGEKTELEVWCCRYHPDFYGRRILGVGDGFPGQRFLIPVQGLMSDGFQILVESLTEPGLYEMWEQREGFDSAGPSDCCYQLDEATGEIIFGDCCRGMAPETEIRIVSCFSTQGSAGNMKAGKTVSSAERESGHTFMILEDGQGGREQEQIDACRVRAFRRLAESARAVTDEDYEQLVRKVPGLRIQAAKVLAVKDEKDVQADNTINLAIRPYYESGMGLLGKGYKQNILAYLEGKRLLGTRICLHSPEYTEICVFAEISAQTQYLNVREEVCQSIAGFFKELEGEFGVFISRSSLYGRIDRLEGVMKIHMLSIEARGNRISRSRRGDVLLPPDGVLLLRDVDCVIVNN